MGSVNIDFIGRNDITQSSHLYSDKQLNLRNDYKVRGNYDKANTRLIDIKISYDMDAIRNSLTAIFSTYPGQRLLLPEFGLNIQRFLFSPVSDTTARAIGELMHEAILKWEPRVKVTDLSISPKAYDHRYDISLEFYVPSLKTSGNFLGSVVAGDGFIRG